MFSFIYVVSDGLVFIWWEISRNEVYDSNPELSIEECEEMVAKDIAIITIEIPPSLVTIYERDIAFPFTDKLSAIGTV